VAIITKELALKIARKLEATIKERSGKAHDIALVYHGGRLVAQFGLRRGSKKDMGHDHIPSQIHVRPSQARLLGQCPMTREEWLRILAERGLL
jgi:hypothetical protein